MAGFFFDTYNFLRTVSSCHDFYRHLLPFGITNQKVEYVQSVLSTGRIDLILQTDTCIYVMEFKLDKSAEEAIAQIDTKDYLISYQLDDRKKVKVGINFSSETRTLDQWIIA